MRRRPKKMSYEALSNCVCKWARTVKDKTPSSRWVAEMLMARLWWLKHQLHTHTSDGPAILEDLWRLEKRKLGKTGTGRATETFLLAERERHNALAASYSSEISVLMPAIRHMIDIRAANEFWKWVLATAPNWLVIGERRGEIIIRGLRMNTGG